VADLQVAPARSARIAEQKRGSPDPPVCSPAPSIWASVSCSAVDLTGKRPHIAVVRMR
jgi:hypothetical protein